AAGVDAPGLGGIPIQITSLGTDPLGLTSGHTTWLDDYAAGRDRFIGPTPQGDSEVTTAGNQDKGDRIDLLTAPGHEPGQILGSDPTDWGMRSAFPGVGTRATPAAVLDAFFAGW